MVLEVPLLLVLALEGLRTAEESHEEVLVEEDDLVNWELDRQRLEMNVVDSEMVTEPFSMAGQTEEAVENWKTCEEAVEKRRRRRRKKIE